MTVLQIAIDKMLFSSAEGNVFAMLKFVSPSLFITKRDSPDCYKAIPFDPSKSYILNVMASKNC